jgi:hypothetical protein
MSMQRVAWRMRSTRALRFLVAGFLLIAVHPLPAPVIETPEVTPSATPKPRRQSASIESAPKQRSVSKPAVSLAGTWTGTASGEMHAPLSPPSYSDSYTIQISADEKTASWTASKWLGARFQAPVQKNGRRLIWSYEKHDLAGKTLINSSLQINPNGTATFVETCGLANGLFKGSGYSVTGTLVRK